MSSSSGLDPKSLSKGIALRFATLLNGLATGLPPGTTTIVVGGKRYTVPDLVKAAQQLDQPFQLRRQAYDTLRQLAISRDADRTAAIEFLAEVKVGLAALFGRKNVDLSKFGFAPAKPRPKMSSEERVLRAAKAKLTREARHTLGRRQKAALTAATPSVSISPDGDVSVDGQNPAKPTNAAPANGATRTA